MLDLGIVRPGTTLYIPFHTFDSNDPSASVTLTGLATTDIEVYKDGSVTQRASDAGYSLLDTDGIDFDSTTGIHGISIDLADNTTAGFYAAGSQYWVVIASVTVDAATVNFVAATFRIGYPDAVHNTTIATYSSQTSFTLTNGSTDNSAYVGWPALIHDVASAQQVQFGVVSAYTGSTKTVTLAADPGVFTMTANDNISLFPPSNTRWAGTTLWGSGAITAGSIASNAIAADKIASGAITSAKFAASAIDATAIASNAITAAKIATDAITADKIAADAIGASELATDAVNEIVDQVWDEAQADHVAAGSMGVLATEIADILTDTNELQTDWTDGGRLDLIIDTLALEATVAALNDLGTADIDARLAAIGLDHLVSAAVIGTDVADNSIIARMVSKSATADWDSFVNTTDALEAIRDKQTDIETDTAEIGAAGAGLTAINLPDQTMNITGDITGNLSGSVGSVTGAVGSVTGSVGSVTGAVGSVTGAVGSVSAGGITAASFGAGAIDAAAIATDAIDADALAADAVDEILDEAYEGTTTLRQFLRLAAAALFGKASGLATTTATYRNEADDGDRIVATVDADGNRTAVTLTKT